MCGEMVIGVAIERRFPSKVKLHTSETGDEQIQMEGCPTVDPGDDRCWRQSLLRDRSSPQATRRQVGQRIPPQPGMAIGEACIAIFLFSPTAKAWPDVRAAPWRVSGCKVEMTVTSSAVGRPLSQLGRKMSAGRAWEPGIRDGNSFLGAKAAV